MDAYQKTRDCLDDLDLRPGASWEDVKAAYHTLVQVWHPDRFAAGTAIQFKAEERFKEAKAAYEWLEDHRLLLEDLAAGRWRPDPGPPKPPEPSDEVELDRDKPWYRRRYSGPIYAARRWMPRVQVPWLFVAALLAAVIIVATNREPEVEPFVFPQVAEAIGSPTPGSLWVYDQRLDLRSLPGVESPPAGSLERGERVRVIERRDGWRRVARLDSDEPLGWVQAASALLASP